MAVWNVALSSSEVAELWNGGDGYSPYNLDDYPTITATDIWDDGSITTFWAYIDSTNYTTTNGTINLDAEFTSETVQVGAADYFTRSFTSQNLSNNTNTEYELYQSIIDFACYEKITEDPIACTNSTIYPSAGTYDFTISAAGYYDITQEETITALDNKTINVIGFYDGRLEPHAENARTSAPITSFTASIRHLTTTETNTTGEGMIFNLIEGLDYNLTISSTGYVTKSEIISGFTSQNYTMELWPANSILINIYEEDGGARINGTNITVEIIGSTGQTDYLVTTGELFVSNLTADNYTINFESLAYSPRSYDVEVGNGTFQTLDAYLVDSGLDSVVFTFKDKDTGDTLEGVTLSIERIINGSWTVVDVLSSDITGRTSFIYQEYTKYEFTATFAGYSDKEFGLDPILFNSYNVWMTKLLSQEDNSDYSGITILYDPKVYYDNRTNNITFIFSSPTGSMMYYGFNITYDGNTNSSTGTNAYGESLDASLTINGASVGDTVMIEYFYMTTTMTEPKTFRMFHEIIVETSADGTFKHNQDEKYGLGVFERVLILTIIVILIAGTATMFGGAVSGGVVAALIMGWAVYIGFIEKWLVLISLIMLFIMILWRSSQ